MEWNSKWDWENLDIFSSKAIASPKKLEAADWGIVEGEGEDRDGGSFNLSGGFGGTSHSASDLGNNSSAKSSISASTESSFKECWKTSNFTSDGFGGFPGDFSSKKVNGDSPPLEASVGSGEQFIGLKLGKRTYFENGCAKSDSKTSSFSDIPMSSMATAKKVKSSCQTGPTPRCQVEGCNLDLSSAKDYYRKHRVCGNHSRCPLVVIGGLERRFCQQCSRFHSLSEFDDQKRSCRRRLSDHNARRRKPHQETIQFNSSSLSSSFYDGRHQLSFVLNNVPVIQTRPAANSTSDSTFSSKYPPVKLKAEKEGGIDGQPHFSGTQLQHTASMPNHAFSRLLPFKGARLEVVNQGLKESMSCSNVDASSLDIRRALSLLSNSWASSCESDLITFDHHTINATNQTQAGIQTFPPQGLPLSSSQYWQVDQQPNDPHMVTVAAKTSTANTNSHYQGPCETRFYSHSMN